MTSNSLRSYIIKGEKILKNANIQTYKTDTKLLMMKITNLSGLDLITKQNFVLDENMKKMFDSYFLKRVNKMPVQYIINECEFMSLNFYVDNNVLIPRQDTEILVETALGYIKDNRYNNILEIGTGSGCIAVSLAYYSKSINITAVDISKKALEVAVKNAYSNNVSNKIRFIHSDIFKNVKFKKYDLIISNPPYIKTGIIKTLDDSVKNYEPIIALDGSCDGLLFYYNIVLKSLDFLKEYGMILFEIGYDQAEQVVHILNNHYTGIQVIRDLAGHNRVVLGIRK